MEDCHYETLIKVLNRRTYEQEKIIKELQEQIRVLHFRFDNCNRDLGHYHKAILQLANEKVDKTKGENKNV